MEEVEGCNVCVFQYMVGLDTRAFSMSVCVFQYMIGLDTRAFSMGGNNPRSVSVVPSSSQQTSFSREHLEGA